MPVQNADVAAAHEEIADLLELEEANPFRVRAYRKAAHRRPGLGGRGARRAARHRRGPRGEDSRGRGDRRLRPAARPPQAHPIGTLPAADGRRAGAEAGPSPQRRPGHPDGRPARPGRAPVGSVSSPAPVKRPSITSSGPSAPGRVPPAGSRGPSPYSTPSRWRPTSAARPGWNGQWRRLRALRAVTFTTFPAPGDPMPSRPFSGVTSRAQRPTACGSPSSSTAS